MPERPLKVGALFSGIGGLELGFHEHPDFEVVFQVEIDPACRAILARHWPGVQQYDDVTEVTYERVRADLGDRADVDVLIGGWPCQDISLAGRRAGLAGQRSGLFFEFARIALEFAPLWVVAENVPGLVSSYSPVDPPPRVVPADGQWRVEETSDLGVVCHTLGELGYGYAFRLLDAQFFGVPQRRRRIFFVGHLGGPWTASAKVLFEPNSSEGDPAEGATEGEDDADPVAGGVGEDGFRGRNAGTERQRSGELTSALTSSDGGVDFDMAEAGHLVPQVFQCHGNNVGEMGTLRTGNGAVTGGVPFVAQRGQGFGGTNSDIAGTLGSKQGPRPGLPDDMDRAGALVLEEALVVGDHFKGDVARTITAHGQGHRYDLDTENFVVDNDGPITFRKKGRAQTDEAAESWVEDDVANTLNGFDASSARSTHAVVETVPIELRMATRSSGATGVGTPGTGFGGDGDPSYPVMASPPPAVSHDLIVRRLTPLECERLQGLPDGWTDGQTDTARYKQLGNAVAVPCSRWIANRLAMVHREVHGG